MFYLLLICYPPYIFVLLKLILFQSFLFSFRSYLFSTFSTLKIFPENVSTTCPTFSLCSPHGTEFYFIVSQLLFSVLSIPCSKIHLSRFFRHFHTVQVFSIRALLFCHFCVLFQLPVCEPPLLPFYSSSQQSCKVIVTYLVPAAIVFCFPSVSWQSQPIQLNYHCK